MFAVERSFPGVKESVPEARAWVRRELEEHKVPERPLEDALLVSSELVTNSILHSRSAGPDSTVCVRLRLGVTTLWLEVTDSGGVHEPKIRRNGHPQPLAESGHGLTLVDHYTTRWWTIGDTRGRTVGAEIVLDGDG
jgi:serine/threonine-protein kinase RsbW